METTYSVPLTISLRCRDHKNLPVWQYLAYSGLCALLPEQEGWKHAIESKNTNTTEVVRLRVERGWTEGVKVRLKSPWANPQSLQVTVKKHSWLSHEGAMILPAIAGALTAIGMAVSGEFGLPVMLLAFLVGFLIYVATFPIFWGIKQATGLSRGELEQLASRLRATLEDEQQSTEAAAHFTADAAEVEQRSKPRPITAADVAPEDDQLTEDELQRKYGYSRGGEIFRFIKSNPEASSGNGPSS